MNPASLSSAGMSPSQLSASGTSQMQGGAQLQGIGQIFGGISGFAQALYQRRVAQVNAKLAQQNELYALQKGESDAMRYGIQASHRMGEIVAAQGASGLDVNSGSSRDVQTSQGKIAGMDMQQIRENAARVAYDYKVQEAGYKNQASLDLRSGINSLVAGGINAASSFIGSSAAVHSKWLQGQQAGFDPAQPKDDSNIIGGVGQEYIGE